MRYLWSCVWECDNTPIKLYGIFELDYSSAVVLKDWFKVRGIRMVCIGEVNDEITLKVGA